MCMIQNLLINFFTKTNLIEIDSISESIELFSSQIEIDEESFYHNGDMWFLFLNIDKDLKPDLPSPDL